MCDGSEATMKTTDIHPEAIQLYKKILSFADEETAREIVFGPPLAPAASPEERAAWVHRVIEALEARFDAATIKAIRLGCYCNEHEAPGKCKSAGYLCADTALFTKVRDWLRELYASSASLEEFVAKANTENLSWYVENGELYTKFFECECPMLEAVGQLPTFTWCYCTAGYRKRLFEAVFDCPVDVEIIHSIRQGNEFCLMKVTRERHAP